MFATESAITPTFASILFSQFGNDLSTHPNKWFTKPSGLEPDSWLVESADIRETAPLVESGLYLLPTYLQVTPLHKPVTVFQPKTELASRLWEIRKRIVASGIPLLDWDGVEQAVAERRGERG